MREVVTKGLDILSEGLLVYQRASDNANISRFIADGCLKRFEYVFNLTLKMMKQYLKAKLNKQEKELTINNIFKLMQEDKKIIDVQKWMAYYQYFLNIRQGYDIENANRMVLFVGDYVHSMRFLLNGMKN